MLIRLLRTHLREYRGAVAAVILFQLVQTSATLYLPSLNAQIIDKGVLLNDRHFIWRTGLLMLGLCCVFAFSGALRPVHGERVELVSWYWHFVDGVWVVVFTVVYVIGR